MVDKKQLVKMVSELENDGGLTLRNFTPVSYKTGWQVATDGVQTTNPDDATAAIMNYNGDCGVWFSDGIYYVDKSKRVKTKHEAMEIGRAHNQISILNWRTMGLAYC